MNKDKVKQLQEEVMNVRLRETQAFAELTEMKQKVMELETQVCNGIVIELFTAYCVALI